MVAGTSVPLGFPRAMRIKQAREFSRVKKEGRRASRTYLIANWTILPGGTESRLGVITSRKIGPAVVRSRARRLLRETFRLHQPELKQPVALVLVAKPAIVGKKLQDVERDFLSVMRQAGLFKEL
jgi:ribonuclease P protein component